MRKVLFSKYNQSRNPKYQTRTIICKDDDGSMYIEKTPVSEAARSHIDKFITNYELTKNIYPEIELIKAEKIGDCVRYPYVDGKSIDELLEERVASWDGLFEELKGLISKYYIVNEEYKCEFEKTKEYVELFGDFDCSGLPSVKPCNIDLILDNFSMVEGNKMVAFDYEWVFDFPLPENYIIYRVLCRFYAKFIGYISPKYSFDEFVSKFDFSDRELDVYRKMEDTFVEKLNTGGESAFVGQQYALERKDVSHYIDGSYEQLVVDYNNAIDLLHDTEKKYLDTIENLNKAANMFKETEALYNQTNIELGQFKAAYENVLNSASWKITKPLRAVKKGTSSLKNDGIKKTVDKVVSRVKKNSKEPKIMDFNQEFFVTDEELSSQRSHKFDKTPKVSIITPLFNTPEKYLIDLLESVKKQTYSNWEFCLVNFSDSSHGYVDRICREYVKVDSRYVYNVASENKGISENTNLCISYATGEYIGLLDHDDILHESALYEVVKSINEENCDFIYTDEIKFEEDIEKSFLPNFKPDFSADELRSHNYICHFCVYSKELYEKAGSYRKEFDGSQDHDIVLRLTEKAEKIVHIPKILYFWRVHPGSVASGIEAKSYATDAGAKAVTEQLNRMEKKQYAESVINSIPLYKVINNDNAKASVSVVLWDIDDAEEYFFCATKLKNAGLSFEKMIVIHSGNNLLDAEADNVTLLSKGDKTYGELWNQAMELAIGEYVLFANGKAINISKDLDKEIGIYKGRTDIAVIDTKITERQKILSGGVCLNGNNLLPFKLRCMGGVSDYAGYENSMMCSRNVVAGLGLFTFVRRDVWSEIKFDACKDIESMIDFSYNAWEKGFFNIWTPFINCELSGDNFKNTLNVLSALNKGKYRMRDPYVSSKVFEYGLE